MEKDEEVKRQKRNRILLKSELQNSDGSKEMTNNYQSGMTSTLVESIPLNEPEAAGHAVASLDTPVESVPLDEPEAVDHAVASSDTPGESIPFHTPEMALANALLRQEVLRSGPIEGEYQWNNCTILHDRILNEIEKIAESWFEPTPWDTLKTSDQVKLNRWASNAKLLIESEPGYPLIFQAWIWHILDDEVFSADPKTKWQDCGDGYEAAKLFSQLLAIVQEPENTNGRNNRPRTSKIEDYPMWKSAAYNKWRSASAEIALHSCTNNKTIDPDCVLKVIHSNLGYLMKPLRYRPSSLKESRLARLAVAYDSFLLVSRVKPRLVWTDPFQQDEQGVLYGFSFTNTLNRESEFMTHNEIERGHVYETRMEVERDIRKTRKTRGGSTTPESMRALSEGKPVELVVSPGLMTRGMMDLGGGVIPVASRLHKMAWRHPMVALVSGTFDPPITPSTFDWRGVLIPGS
ncbi:hypothetical protein SAMD00023353_0400180 [Rosellinia necatrix]|uniref:Uncharacterized protein n=1 Tax=Rosellinia necatrix TaxID=77044 RepID=A0A1S7UIG2_ROSNE|nr:hypothetical protein SAMD00023353_0400180 [Rosellinia necatrix]